MFTKLKTYLRKFRFLILLFWQFLLLMRISKFTYAESEIQGIVASKMRTETLAELFNRYGSDKASGHDYWRLYEPILRNLHGTNVCLVEIGIGSKNSKIPSHMGIESSPGGSLRAFQHFLPNAQIFGADVDSDILFSEERIETCWVDQTRPSTFVNLKKLTSGEALDLILIDGLHQPYAELVSIVKLLPQLKAGGNLFVEDIRSLSWITFFWKCVSMILERKGFCCTLHRMKGGNVFQATRMP